MPGSKFALAKSQNNQALAAAAAASGMGYPAPDAAPAPQGANDILALLQGGKLDPKALMALLALLAGMGPQGPAGAVPQEGGPVEAGPIAQAYGG